MLKVTLTGNIGCGKSTVADMFRELSCYVLDADKIIKGFYDEKGSVYREVVNRFGESILDIQGNIDRKKLASIVFRDKEALDFLEKVTHKALYERLEEIFKTLPKDSIVIVEASLVIEKGTYKNYDKTIVVYAPYEICKERAIKKGFTLEDFELRWKKQMPIEEKVKYADYVIDNSKGLDKTREQVVFIYQKLKEELSKRDL